MKKKFKKIRFACGLAFVTLTVFPKLVHASAPSLNGTASISITGNLPVVAPQDPANIENNNIDSTIDVNGNGTVGQSGFSLDYVPANLVFQSKENLMSSLASNAPIPLASKSLTLFATPLNYKNVQGVQMYGANFAQVTDNTSSGAGWSLSVTQTMPFTYQGTAKIPSYAQTLMQAQLSFGNTSVQGYLGSSTSNVTPSNTGALVIGQAATILSAQTGAGDGTYQVHFGNFSSETSPGNQSIQLFIPNSQVIAQGSYSASLTWTLNNAP